MVDVIILAAGMGTRMGRLVEDMPKPLVPIGARGGPLLYNLDALAASALDCRVIIVTGYRAEKIGKAVAGHELPITLVHNPEYATRGPLASIVLALRVSSGGPVIILNGDTVFDAALFARLAEPARAASIRLIGSEEDDDDTDTVVVDAGRDLIVHAARKRLHGSTSRYASSGLALVPSGGELTHFTACVERLLADEVATGKTRTWHSVFEELHRTGRPASLLLTERETWQEFDTAANVESYRRQASN